MYILLIIPKYIVIIFCSYYPGLSPNQKELLTLRKSDLTTNWQMILSKGIHGIQGIHFPSVYVTSIYTVKILCQCWMSDFEVYIQLHTHAHTDILSRAVLICPVLFPLFPPLMISMWLPAALGLAISDSLPGIHQFSELTHTSNTWQTHMFSKLCTHTYSSTGIDPPHIQPSSAYANRADVMKLWYLHCCTKIIRIFQQNPIKHAPSQLEMLLWENILYIPFL